MNNWTILVFIFIFSSGFSQTPVEYKVRQKPLAVLEKPQGKILVKVPRNKTLSVFSYDNRCDCYLAAYRNYKGFLNPDEWFNDISAVPKDSGDRQVKDTITAGMQRLINERNAAENVGNFYVDHDADVEAKNDLINSLIQKYGYTNGIRISQGKIWLGMSTNMVLDSWGIPFRVNRSQSYWGPREQWIYSDAYLNFENGVLAEILKLNSLSE